MDLPYKFCEQPQAANERQLDPNVERDFETGNPAFFFVLQQIYRIFLKDRPSNRVHPIPRSVADATAAELRQEWEDRLETFVSTRVEQVASAAEASTAMAVREAFAGDAKLTTKDAGLRLASRGFHELPPQSWREGRQVQSKRPYEYAFAAEGGQTSKRLVRLRTQAADTAPSATG
jgi:hypothetical protein